MNPLSSMSSSSELNLCMKVHVNDMQFRNQKYGQQV